LQDTLRLKFDMGIFLEQTAIQRKEIGGLIVLFFILYTRALIN